ncbi:hypothetical protein SDJN03_19261, partial [Cucurbita argyrosperma subsp. sororia]
MVALSLPPHLHSHSSLARMQAIISNSKGIGVGMVKGADCMRMPVVRLLVKDIPVLIAIDQNDKWFTFSEYEEPVTVRSTPPIRC